MGGFIKTVVIIFILLVMLGSCEDCGFSCGGGCDGCDSCSVSCDGCDDCTDEGPQIDGRYKFDPHYGKITLKIRKVDGSFIEYSGVRNVGKTDSLIYSSSNNYGTIYKIKGLDYSSEVGYNYSLHINMDGTTYKFYDEQEGINDIFNNRLLYYHKDGAVVELEERRTYIDYHAEYVIELNGRSERVTHNYHVGDTILFQQLQDAVSRVFSGTRYTFNGFVIDGTSTALDTTGVVDADFIGLFNGKTNIRFKAVAQGQMVNVKLHYNMSGVQDELKQVPFNVNLNSLWGLSIDKLEFLGWSTSSTEFNQFTGVIPEQYVSETLELYAVHKFYKEITIDGQTVRVYDDNTLSIKKPTNALGLKESQTATQYLRFSRVYDFVQEGKTYYWYIAG